MFRQYIGLKDGILFFEQFGRNHGDDVGALPGGFELVGDVHRERHFGTGRDEHGLASPAGFAQTVSAFQTKVFRDVMTQRRQVLAREREQRRPIRLRERERPAFGGLDRIGGRSEEHTSELKSLMRNSYAVFCLKKKKNTDQTS